jgi:dihydroneopterin aldolase
MPNNRACISDGIDDALDYAQVAQHIQTVLGEGHFSLLEALAERIAQIILKDFNAPWVKVSVAKLQAIRNCKLVGVSIERGQMMK